MLLSFALIFLLGMALGKILEMLGLAVVGLASRELILTVPLGAPVADS